MTRCQHPNVSIGPRDSSRVVSARASSSWGVVWCGMDRQDDGCSRALRRRVTLIYGGYRGRPRQSTHDSASSGGRAVCSRALGPKSVAQGSPADPRNRASNHPSSSRSVTDRVILQSWITVGSVALTPPASRSVARPPRRTPRAHGRSPPQSSGPASVSPPTPETVDTSAVGRSRRSRSRVLVARGGGA